MEYKSVFFCRCKLFRLIIPINTLKHEKKNEMMNYSTCMTLVALSAEFSNPAGRLTSDRQMKEYTKISCINFVH